MGNERARKRREARKLKKQRKRQEKRHWDSPSTQLITLPLPGASSYGGEPHACHSDDEECPLCALFPEDAEAMSVDSIQVRALSEEMLERVKAEFAKQRAALESTASASPTLGNPTARDQDPKERAPQERSGEFLETDRGRTNGPDDRLRVLHRVDRTLFDAEFPYRRGRLEQIYRDCDARSIFEILPLPVERTTSPLIAALVDLWNYTPRPPLGDWTPTELLSRFGEERAELDELKEDGRTAVLADIHYVESLHNRAFVDSFDLPEDPVIDKRLLVRAIRAAEHLADEGCW